MNPGLDKPDSHNAQQSSFLYYTALTGGILLLGLIIVPAVLPPVEQSRDAARRSTSKNNLKQIGLAIHLYDDRHDLLPAGSIERAAGQPGHSWLTAILPYIGEEPLYRQIDFN
ncbi:MAG: DUF1559 domain-containing protein, partial [Planctomycetaceae bacterium]|nr:DUF1559 domain-containing protein [Planctomycetaceae bacterium]